MRTDKDLDPLPHRADFQKLAEEMQLAVSRKCN